MSGFGSIHLQVGEKNKYSDTFYFSQLANQVCPRNGIDFNTGVGIPDIIGMEGSLLAVSLGLGASVATSSVSLLYYPNDYQ